MKRKKIAEIRSGIETIIAAETSKAKSFEGTHPDVLKRLEAATEKIYSLQAIADALAGNSIRLNLDVLLAERFLNEAENE